MNQGYYTVDSVTVKETGTHGYSHTFATPSGWVGVTIGATETSDGNFVELATLASLSADVLAQPKPSPTPEESTSAIPMPLITPTPSATATSHSTVPSAEPTSPSDSSGKPLEVTRASTVSDATLMILLIGLVTLIALIPLGILFVRRRMRRNRLL